MNQAGTFCLPGSGVWFLIGYRGTGKTQVARLLARRLGWDWQDADEVLERGLGRSIRQVFAEVGEACFRDQEAGVLARLCALNRHVIATGGGVVLRADNRERLRSAGKVIWLTAAPRTLWQRLSADAATGERRPDLAQGGLAEIEELLKVREPLYSACAHLTVDTTGKSPEEVTAAILAAALDPATPGSP